MAGQRTNEWKLGLFVVTALAVGLASIVWLGAEQFERKIIPAWTYFDESVQGLDVGSKVKFRGVSIGTVAQIGVAPDRRRVAVLMHFYEDVLASLGLRPRGESEADPERPFVPPQVRVQLASAGITGGKFLSLDLFDPQKTPMPELPFAVPWRYVPATPSTLKNVEETVLRLAEDVPRALEEARGFLADVRRILQTLDGAGLTADARALMTDARQAIAQADVPGLAKKTDALLVSLEAAARRLEDVAGDVSGVTGESGALPALLAELRETARTVKEAVEKADLGATTASLRDTSGAVGGLSRDLGSASAELRQALTALRDAAEKVSDLAASLERDPGAVIHGRSPSPPGPGGRR